MIYVLGCLGCVHQTQVILPKCVQEVAFEGEHTRIESTVFQLNHFWDLPFSKTKIEVQSPSGQVETYTYANSQPNWWRVLLSVPFGLASALLLGNAALELSNGGTVGELSTLTALSLGFIGQTGSLALLMTGWHPRHERVRVRTACEEKE